MSLKKINFQLTPKLHQRQNGLTNSELVMEFKGSSIDTAIINTLRRSCISLVPGYAFLSELIEIEENTSVFNDDYMKLRLSQIPIPNVDHKISFLQRKFWNTDYSLKLREKHPDDNLDFQLYINNKNTTQENINITTNDIVMYKNGKEIENPYDKKNPFLLIKLRPSEVFKCRLISSLGTHQKNNIYSTVTNCIFDELNDNHFKLILNSRGQINEYEILIRACECIIRKLDDIKFVIGDNYNNTNLQKEYSVNIKLNNENYTMGHLITNILQEHTSINYAGYKKENLLLEEIDIKIVSNKPNPINPVFDSINYLKNLYSKIILELKSLKIKHKY